MRLGRLFFVVFSITGVFLTSPVMAASSVKNFKGTTSSVHSGLRSNKSIRAQSSGASKKTPSIRMLGGMTKTATKATGNTNTASSTQKKANSVDPARSSGLRGNVIKGISSKLSSNYSAPQSGNNSSSNAATSNLERRFTDLEADVSKKIDETETYIQQNYYDKQYIDQMADQLSNANTGPDPSELTSANTTYVFQTDADGNGTWQALSIQKSWDPEF